jgi:hypothetical protein
VLWEGQIMARHALVQSKGQMVRVPDHFKGLEKGRPGRPVLSLVSKPAIHEDVEVRSLAVYDEVEGVTSRV